MIYFSDCNCEDTELSRCVDKTFKADTKVQAAALFMAWRQRSSAESFDSFTKGVVAKHLYFSVHFEGKHLINITRD